LITSCWSDRYGIISYFNQRKRCARHHCAHSWFGRCFACRATEVRWAWSALRRDGRGTAGVARHAPSAGEEPWWSTNRPTGVLWMGTHRWPVQPVGRLGGRCHRRAPVWDSAVW